MPYGEPQLPQNGSGTHQESDSWVGKSRLVLGYRMRRFDDQTAQRYVRKQAAILLFGLPGGPTRVAVDVGEYRRRTFRCYCGSVRCVRRHGAVRATVTAYDLFIVDRRPGREPDTRTRGMRAPDGRCRPSGCRRRGRRNRSYVRRHPTTCLACNAVALTRTCRTGPWRSCHRVGLDQSDELKWTGPRVNRVVHRVRLSRGPFRSKRALARPLDPARRLSSAGRSQGVRRRGGDTSVTHIHASRGRLPLSSGEYVPRRCTGLCRALDISVTNGAGQGGDKIVASFSRSRSAQVRA